MQIATFAVLGTFSLSIRSTPIDHFPTEKVRALFAYLALEAQAHRREALAELLWPDNAPGMALKNLRLSLYRLRQVIEAAAPQSAETLLLVSRQSIQLNHAAIAVDALDFQATLSACEQHRHSAMADCAACLTRLSTAVEAYHGELLPDLSLGDAPDFDQWLLVRRESLHNQAQQTLQTLTAAMTARADYQQALRYASQALTLDMYQEENHRQVMTLLTYLGQPQRALAQYKQCVRMLQEELGIDPSPETVTLMQQIQTGRLSPAHAPAATGPRLDSMAAPAPEVSPAITHNKLPATLTGFVGRQRELADLTRLIAQPETRLITLTGVGGMGKTRLAIEFARTMLPSLTHGVVFVSLAPLSDPATVATTIAAALGLEIGSDALGQMTHYLHDKRLLLILDNAEHLLDCVGDICLALLEAAPQLQILVTSREQLSLHGEHLYVVPSLDDTPDTSYELAANSPSMTLFIQSAQRAQANFQPEQASLAHIRRICRLVQGMPLGLELAAAWVSHYSLAEIADSIAQSADFLAFNWRGVPQRQRSMRAVFNWSWKLLNPTEQHTLRQVALFRGGFTLEAAQAVAQASRPILIRLTQVSLLNQHEHQAGRRYSMHELLHQFAAEQFDSRQERLAAEARHSSYYLDFLASRERRLIGEEPRLAASEIWDEIDNLRQAWQWALKQAHFSDIERCAHALYNYYAVTGHLAERVQMFASACQALENALAQGPQEPARMQALGKLLALYSMALARHAQNEPAIQIAQQAIALKDWSLEGAALANIAWGYALHNQGHSLLARDHLEHALELIDDCQQDSGMLSVIAWATHMWLGVINTDLNAFGRAREHGLRAWYICQQQQLRFGEVDSLSNLGHIAMVEFDLDAARSYYEQAYQRMTTLGSRTAEWEILCDLSEVLRLQGDYVQAHDLLKQALLIAHDIGDTLAPYLTSIALVRLLCSMGDLPQAQQIYEQLTHYDSHAMTPPQHMMVLMSRTIYAWQHAHHQQALAFMEECWQLAYSYGHHYDQAKSLVLLGHARAALQLPDASLAYRQALTIYQSLDRPALAAEAWAGVAMLALTQAAPNEALQAAEMILQSIDTGVRPGLDEPSFVYQACYRVLSAYNDSRADRVLQAAQHLLQSSSEHTTDSTMRLFAMSDGVTSDEV